MEPIELAAENELPGERHELVEEPPTQWIEWSAGCVPLDTWATIAQNEDQSQTVTGFCVHLPYIMPNVAITSRVTFSESNWKKGAEEADKQRFELLADKWEAETQHLSSVSAKRRHNAYQSILMMGDKAIPWVLARLRPDGASWFYLLDEIVADPPEIERGNVRQIILAWKKWGRERGPGA